MSDEELFSWGLYANLIRQKRTSMGYTTAKKFSAGIYRRTRLRVSSDVLYRIEQCRQEPTAMQFMAINLSLFDEVWPFEVRACARGGWVELVEHYNVPDKWKRENLLSECQSAITDGETSVCVDDLEDEDYYDVYLPESERHDPSLENEDCYVIATVCGIDICS